MTRAETIATNLMLVVFVYLTLYYTICQILFMLLALTIKQIGNEFERKLKSQGYQIEEDGHDGLRQVYKLKCIHQFRWMKIMHVSFQGFILYKELKHTTELIKNVFGNAMIGYYLSSVAYLAEAPHIFLGNRGNHEKIVMIHSFGLQQQNFIIR